MGAAIITNTVLGVPFYRVIITNTILGVPYHSHRIIHNIPQNPILGVPYCSHSIVYNIHPNPILIIEAPVLEPRLLRRKRAKDHGGLKKWIQIYHTYTRPMDEEGG